MANTLLTIDMVTYEALRVLTNMLGMTSRVSREYSKEFALTGAKIGDTVRVRKPPRYIGRTGDAIAPEATTESSVPVTLTTLFGVDTEFSETERLLSLDDYSNRILKPKVATIANKIDLDGNLLYKDVYNAVGTPGTVPSTFQTYLDAGVKMDNEAAPDDGERYMGVSPAMRASIVNASLALFNPQTDISQQYRRGRMGDFNNFEWFQTQNAPTHTVGPLGGTPLVNGANQTGASLITDGWTAAAANRLKKGDVFTIANVNAVNPQSRLSTGQLRQFVVTADADSDGSGNVTISISPSITASGAFQTVDSLPADNAAITVLGAANTVHRVGLAFHRDFATLATADLPEVKGVHEFKRVSDPQTGLSLRSVTAYDINSNKTINRLEILYGWKTLYPELACRVSS